MVPVTCKFCASLGDRGTVFWTSDDRKKHAQLHAFQSGYISEDGERMSVRKVFGQCFPLENFFEKPMEPMEPANEKTKVVDKSRSMLMEICQRIIKSKKNESKSIECQLCKSNVRYCVGSNGKQSTQLLLDHGCSHSTKKPFACRQCQRETATKRNLVQHFKKGHKIDSPAIRGVHFDENWAVCFDEVKETLTKCFGVVDLDPDLSHLPLAIQRRLIFSNALKNTDDAGKIRCDQCQREIFAKCRGQLVRHVCFHLRRGIYKCTKCYRSSPYKSSITHHLAKQHSVLSPSHPSNYIDRSDEHHEEILDCLKKCFGKEDSK